MATFHKNKVVQSGLKVLVNTLRKIIGNLGFLYQTPFERSFLNKVSLIDPNQNEDSYSLLNSVVSQTKNTMGYLNSPWDGLANYNGSYEYQDHSTITASNKGGYIVDGSWTFSSWFNIVKPQFFKRSNGAVGVLNIRKKNCILATLHSFNINGMGSGRSIRTTTNRIVIAKRGPYYRNINGYQYQYIYEPFSFVFVLNRQLYGSNHPSLTFFTDYKFYHNQFYNISLVYDNINESLKVYIDGNLEYLAVVNGAWHIRGFKNLYNHKLSTDPTIYSPGDRYTTSKLYNIPIHPNFKNYFNGTADANMLQDHNLSSYGIDTSIVSKISVVRLVPHPKVLPYKERFLHNRFIDYGDVQIYNKSLTKDEIVSNYENFYTKYKANL